MFLELKRRGGEIYYFKGKQECDFIQIHTKIGKSVYQVCSDLYEQSTKSREVNGLIEAMIFFNLDIGYILTMSEENEILLDRKKIIIKPVWKWLLEV